MLFKDTDFFVRMIANGIAKTNDKYNFLPIMTKDCRLFCILSGGGTMKIEENEYTLVPGTVICFQSGIKYVWQCEYCRYIAINFDYTQNFSHIKHSFGPIFTKYFNNDTDIFENIAFDDARILNVPIVVYARKLVVNFKTMLTEFHMENPYREMLLSSMAKTLLIEILKIAECENRYRKNNMRDAVEKTVSYILNNYEKKIDAEVIESVTNFNYTYLNRMFKKTMGKTIHSFTMSHRLNMAVRYLSTEDSSISEIAVRVGFCDLASFSKAFKNQFGMSPTRYKNKIYKI